MVGENILGASGVPSLMAFGVTLLIFVLILGIAIYVYSALAWQMIARKLKHNYPWFAWIPIANIALILELGGFHWAWVFLVLIPILGWIALGVFGIISLWRIFEKRGYPGWLGLIPILSIIPVVGSLASIALLVIIGFVAWGK